MAVTRTFTSLGVVATDAETVIPPTPISGTAYRNEAFSQVENETGERFDTIADSADFNQKQFIISSFTNMIDTNGVPGWTDLVDYAAPALVWGSDNLFYFAIAASGPSTTPQDPVSTVGFWEFLDTTNDQEIANIASAVTTYADAGIADAYDVTGVGPASPNAYIEGTKINFYANFDNTGASTIDVNGLGVRPLVNEDTSALSANQVRANTWTQVIIEGANAVLVNSSERLSFDLSAQTAPTGASLIGTAAEGGTTVEAVLTQIGVLPFAWAYVTGLNGGPAVVAANKNIASVNRVATGLYDVTFSIAASNTQYGIMYGPESPGGDLEVITTLVIGKSVNGFTVRSESTKSVGEDVDNLYIRVFLTA